MGGGTKEKEARQAAESRTASEMAGLRTLLLLMFGCIVFFTLTLAVNLSMSLESPQQQAALFLKMAKEKAERNERWKRRSADLLAFFELSKESSSTQMLKRDSEGIPPWASARDSTTQKKKRKKLDDQDDEVEDVSKDDAEMEIRTKMGEWMREASAVRQKALTGSEDSVIASLRKRQQFVEDGLDAVTARDPEVDDFDLSSLLDTDTSSGASSSSSSSESHSTSKSAHTSDDEEQLIEESADVSTPILGVSASNSAIKALRTSNLFALSGTSRGDKLFSLQLARLGYSTSPSASGKSLPLWVLSYGQKCPETPDPTERHILICPAYIPSSPGARYLPVYQATRSSESVMREMLARSRHKRSDARALAQALAEVYGSEPMASESFRLFKDKARLESHLARDAERRPVFVLQQNDGTTQPQLTNNVASILAGEKKYAAKQLVLRRFNLNPWLWEEKVFVIRSYAVIFHSDPLLALYLEGPVLRASEDFSKPSPNAVESAPVNIYFPGSAADAEAISLARLVKSLKLKDVTYLRRRLKQLTAFAVASLGVPSAVKPEDDSRAKQIGVQHLCFDFTLEKQGDGSSYRVVFEDIRTDCTLDEKRSEGRALVDGVAVLAEEMLFRKTRQEAFGFDHLPSLGSVTGSSKLEVLFDEVKEQEKGRSLMDAMEDLAATRAVSSTLSRSQATCEGAIPVLGEGQNLQTFGENFPLCSSSDLDQLFSTAAVVGNGEAVDAETFFNAKIERALQSSIRSLFQGNFRSAVNEARLAGYAPCNLVLKRSVAAVLVPTSKGLSPVAIKVFSCGSSVTKGNHGGDVVVEIPHPFFDHTRDEGIALFTAGWARALILSGTHRCAIAAPSGCTGSIGKPIRTNCAGRPEYQNGDAAHAVETTFQVAHVALAEFLPTAVFVSLHATKQDTFIVSDGTSSRVTPSAAVAKVVSELAKQFPATDIASCNDFENSPSKRSLSDSEKDVCGATNVQGRHLNGAPDPCQARVHENGSPLHSSGRFVHIEQPVQLVKESEQTLIRGIEKALKDALA